MIYLFDDYTLNTELYELRHAGTPCPLEPQVLDILLYLIQYRDRVVTRQELLDHVWPERCITETTLDHRLMQARQAIGDSGQTQRRIKTLRGRGYRFVAAVEERLAPACHTRHNAVPLQQGVDMVYRHDDCWRTLRTDTTSRALPTTAGHRVPAAVGTPAVLVERDAELRQLHQWYAAALQGLRQVVFVTGEAGIGKTTLVDAFIVQVVAAEPGWVGRGQCIEQHGVGEPYLPLLEALGQLARTPHGAHLVAVLRQHAPSWLLHMPALVSTAEFDALQRQAGGTTRERMLRELAEAVEILTAEQPLVLVLEDLHWSDGATLDWLAYMARRRGTAQLLVLGTYRPGEALAHVHPVLRTVTQELQMHSQCAELRLAYFSEVAVAVYLTQRFPGAVLPEGLAAFEASGRGDMLAEAYRLQGEFLLRQTVPDAAQAEACLQQALAIARRQQAKSWELRAAMSLARLWQQQGKRAEARELLASIYGWFTEGFDTTDLQDAQALLHVLT